LHSVFYDLETSDQQPVGQILNFCFFVVDHNFEIVDECRGEVALSRLQLPRLAALLANRIKIIDHQAALHPPEWEAMGEIFDFLDSWVRKEKQPLAMVGYNSNRFDLPFLRTSLIRNGFAPYFGGRLIVRDLLHAVRHLYVNNPDFPAPVTEVDGVSKLSLTMEKVCQSFNILSGEQTHESSDDVRLSVSLAKLLLDKFGLDIRTYDGYEVLKFHSKFQEIDPLIVERRLVNYQPDQQRYIAAPMLLYDCDHRGNALWVNLDLVEDLENQRAIQWSRPNSKEFILGSETVSPSSFEKQVQNARTRFSSVSLKTFFSRPICDIEQHIYRIHENGFSGLDRLCKAIELGDRSILESDDEKTLFLRYFLNRYEWGSGQDDKVRKLLARYASYRYAGGMILSKYDESVRHPTLMELEAEIEKARIDSPEDSEIRDQIVSYYQQSEIKTALS